MTFFRNEFHRRLRVPVLLMLGSALFVSTLAAGSGKKRASDPSRSSDQVRETPPLFPEPVDSAREIQGWCSELSREIAQFKWKLNPCKAIDWKVGGHSVKGRPLVYTEFGDPAAPNTTLIFTAVHGDEITPVYIGIRLALWLKEREHKLRNVRVIVAPLVNPDGFFVHPRTRTNARGVDINRNLGTQDWKRRAVTAWKVKYHSDPRRNPGREPHSEPETIFQEEIIRKVRPQKILAIHSPLNFLDYDGPSQVSLDRFPQEYVQECMKLRNRLKAISGGFFPGSLGNFAGQEMGIPTLTLELPTADPARALRYWETFSKGIGVMIDFIVPGYSVIPGGKPTDASRGRPKVEG